MRSWACRQGRGSTHARAPPRTSPPAKTRMPRHRWCHTLGRTHCSAHVVVLQRRLRHGLHLNRQPAALRQHGCRWDKQDEGRQSGGFGQAAGSGLAGTERRCRAGTAARALPASPAPPAPLSSSACFSSPSCAPASNQRCACDRAAEGRGAAAARVNGADRIWHGTPPRPRPPAIQPCQAEPARLREGDERHAVHQHSGLLRALEAALHPGGRRVVARAAGPRLGAGLAAHQAGGRQCLGRGGWGGHGGW